MSSSRRHVWQLLLLGVVLFTSINVLFVGGDDISKYPLLIPNLRVQMDDAYMCTQVKMDLTQKKYIVGFEPDATAARVHHIIINGCKTPGTKLPAWSCGHQKMEGLTNGPICGSGDQVIYAWARDAPQLDLPEGVGFEVGGDSPIQYLVMQVHYAHKLPENVVDNSGVILHYSKLQVPKQASVLKLMTSGSTIQPHSVGHWESACRIEENKTMHPFAYRVHTHDLGVSVSVYRVRRDANGTDVWTMLGRRDPKLPQMFNPVIDAGTVVAGDQLAARCTMNNFRDHVVKEGALNSNEMCMLYLMYWVENSSPLKRKYCITSGPPNYSWTQSKQFNNIPGPDADEKPQN